MENQTLIEVIEDLKNAGLVHSDADFCRKTGLQPSFVSEMKSGKKPFTAYSRKKIEETFADFFAEKVTPVVEMSDTLGDLVTLTRLHLERGHDELDRLIALMEKKEGIVRKSAAS